MWRHGVLRRPECSVKCDDTPVSVIQVMGYLYMVMHTTHPVCDDLCLTILSIGPVPWANKTCQQEENVG